MSSMHQLCTRDSKENKTERPLIGDTIAAPAGVVGTAHLEVYGTYNNRWKHRDQMQLIFMLHCPNKSKEGFGKTQNYDS